MPFFNLSDFFGNFKKNKMDKERSSVSSGAQEQQINKIGTQTASCPPEERSGKEAEKLHVVENENRDIVSRLRALEAHLAAKDKEIDSKNKIISEYEKKIKDKPRTSREETAKRQRDLEATIESKNKKIGEILLANGFISRDILGRALEYQKQFGGGITQYLLAYGYIDETQLAQCLCAQFGIPYLPLNSCDIGQDIVNLIPVDIAEKYWLMPVDKQEDSLMVVMADPLDINAIREVEEVTGCKVQRFVGILSEIITALEYYYKVIIKEKSPHSRMVFPIFIENKTYKGIERRRSFRFKARVDVEFPVQGYYKKSKTKNVSRDGFLLESEGAIAANAFLPLTIHLPKEFSPFPIMAVTQVVRVVPLEDGKFDLAVKTVKISREELLTVLEYASSIYKEE